MAARFLVSATMPERHHYVPRLLLNGFSRDEKIWLFDKQTEKTFQTNTKNAFVEGDFIVFLNSRQVGTSHRFLGSRDNDFPLAMQMIKENPELKAPNMIQFG